MQEKKGRCWVEINLDTIKRNYRLYSSLLRPDQEIMAVVKADAYGHGDREVATALQEIGCRHFAVSNIQEALNLRAAPIEGEILILGYTPPYFFSSVSVNNITQAVLSEEYAELLAANGEKIKCQFAIDTGMNRIGLDADRPEEYESVIRKFASNSNLDVTGIFTHLCVADSEDAESKRFTDGQIGKFQTVADSVKDLSLAKVHCLNTAGGLWHNIFGNIVRLGISLYGLKPDYQNVLPDGIQPAMEWKSVVSMVKQIRAGEDIGYGRTFHATESMTIATIPTGYADGYNRHLSNKGYVLIKGQRAPIVGRICMDQMMVDVSKIPNVHMGDVVTLIGKDGDEVFTADDMAKIIGTIGYEVICCISKRVERVYISHVAAREK